MLDVMMFSVPSNVLPFVKDPEIAVHADSAMQVFCTVCFVMSISVLFCPVLFCFVLSSSVLYCSVQFCSVQFEFCLASCLQKLCWWVHLSSNTDRVFVRQY